MALGAFLATLAFPIPPPLAEAFRFGWLVPAAAAVAAALVLRASRKAATMAVFAVVATTFALSLAGAWRTGVSQEYTLVGGLLPSSHTIRYGMDALGLERGERLSSMSTIRPLFPAFLGSLAALAGDLAAAIGAIVFLAALSCAAVVECARRSFGIPGALVALTATCLFYRWQSGTLMTEHLGLTLGAVGVAALWRAAARPGLARLAFGAFAMALASCARSGAVLVLPATLLWIALMPQRTRSWRARASIVAAAAMATALVANGVVDRAVGSLRSVSFWNSTYMLYGLASGGESWQKALEDHPELATVTSDQEVARRVLRHTLDLVRDQPSRLVVGLAKNFGRFLSPTSAGAFSFVQFDDPRDRPIAIALRVVLMGLMLSGIAVAWRDRRFDPRARLLLAWAVGLVASGALLSVDPGRIYAATVPIQALLCAAGLHILRRAPPLRSGDGTAQEVEVLVVGLGGLVTVLAVAGPLILIGRAGDRPPIGTAADRSCAAGETGALVEARRSAGIRVEVDVETRVGRVNQVDLRRGLARAGPEIRDSFGRVPEGSVVLPARDLERADYFYLVLTDGGSVDGVTRVCGRRDGHLFFVRRGPGEAGQ